MASAALDRLLHRATVVNIRGESYRLRHQKQKNLGEIEENSESKRQTKEVNMD